MADQDRKPAATAATLPILCDGETEIAKDGTPVDVPRRLFEMRQQINALPGGLKNAHVTALERDPGLVEKETPPLRFLRHADFDAAAAAQLMAAHWTMRADLFKEKAYLPMALTGEGTLHRTDMSMLSTGFLVVLPNDRRNRSVLCYDAGRLEKHAKEYQLRVAFYLLSVACENPQAQLEGLVLLFLMEQFGSRSPKRQSLQEVVQVMPCRIRQVFCVRIASSSSPSQNGRPATANEEAASMLHSKKMAAAVTSVFGPIASEKVVLLQGPKEHCLSRLQAVGLARQNVPKSMGGDWGYESFVQWQELRTRYEWGLPPGVGGKDSSTLFDFANSTMNLKTLNEEDRTERKRRLNVLHSRRKREREKVEIEVLQEQSIELEEKNRALDEDNERLQILIAKAEEIVERSNLLSSDQQGTTEHHQDSRRSGMDREGAASYPSGPPPPHPQPQQTPPHPYAAPRHPPTPGSYPGSPPGAQRDQRPEDRGRDPYSASYHHHPEQQNLAPPDPRLLHQQHPPSLLPPPPPPSYYPPDPVLSLPAAAAYPNQPIHPTLLQQLHIQDLQRQLAAQQGLLGHLLGQQQQWQQQQQQGGGGGGGYYGRGSSSPPGGGGARRNHNEQEHSEGGGGGENSKRDDRRDSSGGGSR